MRARELSLRVPAYDPERHNTREEYEAEVAGVQMLPDEATAVLRLLLEIFNAENFTGMLSDGECKDYSELLQHFKAAMKPTTAAQALTCDGEVPAPALSCGEILLAAVALARAKFDCTSRWRLRALFRWQLCLLHRSHSLYTECLRCVEAIPKEEPLICVELAHVLQYYHRADDAGLLLYRAVDLSGLRLEEAAIAGVRTRYQTISHAQSVLVATSSRAAPVVETETELATRVRMPKVIGAFQQGHDLYDRPVALPKGEDAESGIEAQGAAAALTPSELLEHQRLAAITPLHPDDVAIILGLCGNIKNTNPYHGLTKHHIHYYVERVVVDPSPPRWILRGMTLLLRSRVEQQRNRVQERAFLQLQELVDQFGSRSVPVLEPTLYRAVDEFIFAVAWPPLWVLKKELSRECLDLSLVKTALELNEEIGDWEGVIECCAKLDRRKKAESIIREKLDREPENPLLLVALGDATRDDAHLWRAWELCNHKLAAPMRSLARLALERQQYDKVIEYFDQAVAINPLFGGDWFSLGYAAIRSKCLPRAAAAFTRVCQMDPEDSFAWANLGTVYLQLGKRREAFHAMSQALRSNRRSWQLWDNYFHVGLEVSEITEALLALETAVSLAGTHYQLDATALKDLTRLSLQYLKGEIKGRDNDPTPPESQIPHARFEGSAAETGLATGLDAAGAVEEQQDGGFDWGLLAPLTSGLELPTALAEREAQRRQMSEAVRASEERSKQRFQSRLREVLLKLTNMFSTNAQLYATCAQLLGHLEGRRTMYEYHLSELRARRVSAWERSDESFEAVVRVLVDLSDDALALSGDGDPAPLRTVTSLADEAIKDAAPHMSTNIRFRKLEGVVRRLKEALHRLTDTTPPSNSSSS